jgi:tRNA threonylcarbamoyladenosine biosynthesis protein TsaB
MKPTPLILTVETSGRTGSIAISLGEQMLGETNFTGTMRHSAEIFPAIDGLLKRFNRRPREIEHIYISIGPGSFTGLRIAVALAKSMHLANAAKIVAVDTLDVLAANATDLLKEEKIKDLIKIATILDAKRGQYFIAVYQNGRSGWEKILPDCLMTAEKFLENFAGSSKPIWLLGEGLVFYKDKFKSEGIQFLDEQYWYPRAEKVYKLGWQKALAGQFADPIMLQPAYLRKPDIKEK